MVLASDSYEEAISVRLPATMKWWLMLQSEVQGVPMSEVVRECVKQDCQRSIKKWHRCCNSDAIPEDFVQLNLF